VKYATKFNKIQNSDSPKHLRPKELKVQAASCMFITYA